ncbi:tetratricopeptide repeat protein [Anatilimnocola sp. NA78]|uniref:tetratricopeptide repeat protein n=1 Tax=Anatilimnocola sp. NA78 TaxID=3415683 RepID=UPI003CE4BB76
MKLILSWACLMLSMPLVVLAVPPRDGSRKPQQPGARPTPNQGTPSLSSVARPNSRPQPSGNFGRPSGGSDANRRPPASMLPTTVNRPPTSSGNRQPTGSRPSGGNPDRPNIDHPGGNRPGFDRPNNNRPENNRPGGNRPNFGRPIDHRPDVVVNRPDVNFHRPTINRPVNNTNIVNVNRPITNINNNTVNNTVINQNTNVINKNYGTQNTFNRRGDYNRGYSGNYYRPPRDYYPQLHNHWRPTTWSGDYRPAFYNFGYSSGAMTVSATNFAFSNPYYVQPSVATTVLYDYSQPIRVPDPTYQETNDDLVRSERAIRRFDDAREVFRRGEYGRASELIDEAIELLPSDPNLHEFRSLVLFARGRYSESAAALYSVLAVSSGWDAGTIAKLYDDPQTYLKQAAALEEFARANLKSMDARFLLVYHDLVRGDQSRAERLLESIVAAQPEDRVTQTLLAALKGKISEESQADPG